MSLLGRFYKTLSQRKGELLFAAGTMSTPLAALLAGIITSRSLLPAQLGVFNAIGIIPAYLAVLHFGVFSGLARNYPIEIGSGHPDKAAEYLKASGAVAKLVGLAGAIICLLLAVREYFSSGDVIATAAMVATAVAVFTAAIVNHVDTAYRVTQKFYRNGWVLILGNFGVFLSSMFVVWYGMWGAVIRILACGLMVFALRWGPEWQWQWRIHWPVVRQLARVGFPLLLSGTFFSFLMVADRSVVALMLTKADVGHFSLASMLVSSMQFLPQSFSMILFPQMARHYGQHRSSRSLRRYFYISLLFNVCTIVPLSLIMMWAVDPLVHYVFPAYTDGIPAAKIACWTCVCWVYLGVGSVIGVVNRMKPYLIAMVCSLAIVWGLGIYLVKTGHGIEGAAWARFFGTLALCIFTIGYAWYLTSVEVNPAAVAALPKQPAKSHA